MTETLQEFVDSRGVTLRVDAETGVIRGVKILGLQSRNGRVYLADALAEAVRLYEDAKVNVNHPKGNPAAPRDYRDRIGVIRNVAVRAGEGLFADFHFNPRHALAEQLVWDAEHAPENVGFSHNVQARCAQRNGRVAVEAITRVQSVDLVADPATTRGLFESGAGETASTTTATGALTIFDLKRDRPELVEAILSEPADELRRLQEEVERLEALNAMHGKRQTVRRLLREFHLPDLDDPEEKAQTITSDRFVASLLAAESERAMRELVEERAALVRGLRGANGRAAHGDGKPCSRDQHFVDHAERFDTKRFVEAIT